MTLQNRVLPTGVIVPDPARGTLTGNRGILHRDDQTLGPSRWTHKAWICCTLDWQDRKRPVMTGRNWTELFFLDEPVALAAGHRPCGYCRRQAYDAFVNSWTMAHGTRPKAPDMDHALHAARVNARDRTQIRHLSPINELPDGTMILHENAPYLVTRDALYAFAPAGYALPIERRLTGHVTVLTPAPTVAVLQAGYRPVAHPTARS